MRLQKGKQALLASIVFLLAFYLPPFMNVRYTNAMFLLWLPLLLIDSRLMRLKHVVIITIATIATFSLIKSVENPFFIRDALIFSFYNPLVITCGFISGKKMSENGGFAPKLIVLLTVISQAVLCLVQIYSPEIGLLSVRLYSLEKYVYNFSYLRNPKSVGTFGNHNYLAFIFLLSILLVITYFENKKSILLFFSITLFLLAMFSTGSRAAFLFLVILIVLLIFFKLIAELGKRRETLVFALIVLALLGLLAVLFVAGGIELFNLITSFFKRGTPEYSSWKEVFGEERIVVWSNAEISQMGTAEFMFGRSYGTRVTTDNLYLSLLIMYGLVGMILILILNLSIFVTISSGYVSSRARILAFCLLIVFGISGVVADYWFNSSITPIYMFMTGSLFEEINRRHKQRREN